MSAATVSETQPLLSSGEHFSFVTDDDQKKKKVLRFCRVVVTPSRPSLRKPARAHEPPFTLTLDKERDQNAQTLPRSVPSTRSLTTNSADPTFPIPTQQQQAIMHGSEVEED